MDKNRIFILIAVNLFLLLTPVISQTGITLLYKPASSADSTVQLRPQLIIENNGSSDVRLADIAIRYYYTKDGDAEEAFSGEYTGDDTVTITYLFGDGYVEIGFSPDIIVLAPGQASGEIRCTINKAGYSAYDQLNDYSYDGTITGYTPHDTITVYENDTLVWGNPPTPETLPTPDPSKRKLIITEIGRMSMYCAEAVEVNPPGVWVSGSKIYWYDYGTMVSIKLIAGTPRPTAAGGENYQTITINGSRNPLQLVMDEDREVTIEYTTHIVATPTATPTPTPSPMILLHLNVTDSEASEPGSDTAKFSLKEEFIGVVGDGWVEVDYTISGSATNGIDYEELTGTVWVLFGTDLGGPSPPPGVEKDTITVIPIDDLEKEGPETVTITLHGYGDESATITIKDNEPEPTPLLQWDTGDVNNDGTVDIIDALLVAQVYVGLAPPAYVTPLTAGDVNCDESVDIIDALLIAQFYVGIIDQLCE